MCSCNRDLESDSGLGAHTVIDFHTHVFPDSLATTALASLRKRSGIAPAFDGTVAGLGAAMARAGVATSVIQPVASKASQVRPINDWLAALDDPRIVPFGAMHPDFADPAAELARLADLGFAGIKLHPEYQSFRPDEERLEPLYSAAAKHHLIVFFHAGCDITLPSMHSDPQIFARLLDRFPDLTVVLAHMGGWRQWDEVLHHLVGREVYLDTSFTMPYLSERRFCEIVAAHGAQRILFGSDGPWADVTSEVACLGGLPLAEEARQDILWRNAALLLGSRAQQKGDLSSGGAALRALPN